MRWRRVDEPRWRLAAWFATLAAVAAASGALLLHFVGTPWQYPIVLTSVAHYLMWAAPVGLLAAVALRRWWTGGAAALVTVTVLAVQVPANLSDAGDRSGPRLVVLQANLKVGAADPAALTRIVRRNHVDVLATEELTPVEQQRLLAAGLPRLLPYHYLRPLAGGGGGLGLWSRYRLRDVQDVPGFWLGVLRAAVDLPVAPAATVLAVHLTPPYPYSPDRWRREIARLRDVLPRSGPVIAAGDFNATTDHVQFRNLLAHGYDDATEQAGAGYLPTYPNDRWFGPVIGIDHVLVRGGIAADRADTLELPGSDHRGLLVRVRT